MDAYTEVGGRAMQDAKAEVIGRVESGTETESDAGTLTGRKWLKTSGTSYLQDVGKGREQERKLFPAKAEKLLFY